MADTDTNELAHLDNMIKMLSSIRGIPLAKVLRNAAKDVAQGAYRATPMAKITRSPVYFLKNPRTGSPRWVNRVSYGKDGPLRPHPKWRKVSKGFAKASWVAIMRNLGMGTGSSSRYPSAQKEGAVVASASDKEPHPFVRMIDALSYLGKLDQTNGIAQAGIRLAESRLMKALTAEYVKAAKA